MKRNQERDWTVTFRICVAGWKIPVVLGLGCVTSWRADPC